MLAHTDIIFPSDNDYGIPVLDASLQSEAVYAPFARWGSYARSTRMVGCTWHFYTDDYKFSRLWKNPDRLLATGCAAVVEVNYSLAGETPLAYALWATYQKRWLARYWQAQDGVRVLVDLTVPERFQAVNLLGVPKGWGAFAYRATSREGTAAIEAALDAAQGVAGGVPPVFVVYGGGREIQTFCQQKGLVWIAEDMARKPWRDADG